MKNKLLIFGNSDYAVRMFYFFRDYYDYDIVGFCVDQEYKKSNELENLPVYDTEYVLKNFKPNEYLMHIAIGYSKLNKIKADKYNFFKNHGYAFANFIHPSAVIERNVSLGDNIFIGALANIGYNTSISNNVYISNTSLIAHDCVIEDNCYIASSKVAGYAVIKQNCFIGINASIRDKITIGEYSIVSMGCPVTKSLEPYSMIGLSSSKIIVASIKDNIHLFKI